jgi:exosome complex RNA-binding protein Csl4
MPIPRLFRESDMSRDRVIRAALVSGLTLRAACRQSAPGIPVEPASIAGRVTAVKRSGERIGSVRVEERPTEAAGSAKAVVRIRQGTSVIGAPPDGRSADFNALRVGQWVRVWFVGPVRESYPVQADAGTIVIDSIGDQSP